MSDLATIADGFESVGNGLRPTGSIHDYRHDPIVYYMRMDRLIKIGTTTNICMRAGAIMPQGVLAVEWGARIEEGRRHAEFWSDYSHGEWFWLREPLWAHIQSLRETAEDRLGLTTEAWLEKWGVRQ